VRAGGIIVIPRIPARWNHHGTRAAMKEIFVVDSYAQSPAQVEMLASMVDYLTKTNREICLVSHLPIPQRLVNDHVKFTIFDRHNILGPPVGGAFYKFLNMEVRCNPADFYHGAAVYLNLYNALRLLAYRYQWVHFLEADLDVQDVQKHLDGGFAQLQNQRDLSVIGYPLHAGDPIPDPTAIVTNLISLRPEIVDLLPPVFSWVDYERLCAGDLVILEAFLMNQFKAKNVKYALLPDIRLANKSHISADHTAFKCRQNNPLFSVFVISHTDSDIDVKSKSGRSYLLKPGHVCCMHDISASDELLVTYGDAQKVFRHPVETLRLGAFKKQGANLCPDWIE
jgi:hypothetical protein